MPWNENNDHQQMDKQQKAEWEIKLENKLNHFKSAARQKFGQAQNRFSFKQTSKYVFVGLLAVWLCSGFYIIDQGNRGVETRFEAYHDTTMPGPHWHWPAPIESVTPVNVEKQRYVEIGYRTASRMTGSAAILPEALMLTQDENIVSVSLAVQYRIKDARDYLFNVKNSEKTLKQVTESVQRGVIGANNMDFILTEGRSQAVSEIKDGIQKAMDAYGTGLRITSVNLQDAQPPEQVQYAFEDAIRAREDKQRLINEAQAYANEVVPRARGEAARMIQEAEGYEAQIVAHAKGESERFDQLLVEYEKAPKITRKRLYLESKEKLYRNTNKVLVNVEQGNNMFYMPLNAMNQGHPQANNSQHLAQNNQYSNQGQSTKPAPIVQTASGIRTSRSRK